MADDGSVADERSEGRVNIYFANSVEAEALRVGEKVRFEAVIENPRNAGNPAEFDVERAMQAVGELDSRAVSDDIVSNIFSRFCVGK